MNSVPGTSDLGQDHGKIVCKVKLFVRMEIEADSKHRGENEPRT